MAVVSRWLVPSVFVAAVLPFAAQQAPPSSNAARGGAGDPAPEEGIPVRSEEVRRACGACHASDDAQRMTRISYRRASPENWELTIRRMMSLNGVQLTPERARSIIKYLADHHGLAPEEARAAAFEAERRMIDYTYTAHEQTHELCSTCHSMGRVISERRTKDEWELLLAMHRGYYPLIDGASGGFRRGGQQSDASSGGRGGTPQQPMNVALEHLTGAFPLHTPEWSAWAAAMRSPRLAGRWVLAGYQPGQGPLYGHVTINDQPGTQDGFVTDVRFVYAHSGDTVARASRGIVYTGFQWRGRSPDPTNESNTWREVAFLDRDGQQMTGRWFAGAYDEIGADITLRRAGSDPMVAGTSLPSLKQEAVTSGLRIYGANFPARVSAADIDLGQGVTVSRVAGVAPDVVTVDVEVASDARVGPRDLSVAGAVRPSALVVYDKVDGLKVLPQAGMARVGGIVFPKQLQQFEAVAVHHGADGKPDTGDDLRLGRVDVQWSLEEYAATFRDDDLAFVGELDSNGLFTPNADGPNPERSGNRNNIGDVWVVATYTPEDGGRPIRARAHLLVTVPLYMNWAPRELAR